MAHVLIDQIPFLTPNQQCKSTEGNSKTDPKHCAGLILSSSTTGLQRKKVLVPLCQLADAGPVPYHCQSNCPSSTHQLLTGITELTWAVHILCTHLTGACTPQVDAWPKAYTEYVLWWPINEIQVEVILKFRCIKHLERYAWYFANGLKQTISCLSFRQQQVVRFSSFQLNCSVLDNLIDRAVKVSEKLDIRDIRNFLGLHDVACYILH